MPVLPEGIHPIEPDGGQEWIINHIRKMENAVDDILFALRAGGYRMMQGLPLAVSDGEEQADLGALSIVDGKSCDNACPCYGRRHMHRWFEDGDIRDRYCECHLAEDEYGEPVWDEEWTGQ